MDERSQLEHEAIELALASPQLFRQMVMVGDNLWLADQIQPWQQMNFEFLDQAWMRLAGIQSPVPSSLSFASVSQDEPQRPCLRRAYIERPRGHSKTSDMALQITWVLLAAQRPVIGVAAAADREQAGLLLQAIQRLTWLNPALCSDLKMIDGSVRHRKTGSRLDLISSDVGSSYGILPDFVICDELSHWEAPDLWYSLLSSAAKKPDCVLAVLTNAGVGRGWQWDVRENARTSNSWHFSSLDGPHAPWITAHSLEEQRSMLPPAVYERLWLNRWQHSDGEFVSLSEAEACIDPNLTRQDFGQSSFQYVGAIDYAEKHDYTAAVVMHAEGDRYIVDRMDVVRPTTDHPTPVAWVDDWIQRAQAQFPGIRIILDDYQLLGTAQKYPEDEVSRFRFGGGSGNHNLAIGLRHLILQKKVAWYPGCGNYPAQAIALWQEQPVTPSTASDDLTSELASLLLCQSSSGRVRIDHRSDSHDDRAFVLGLACLALIKLPRNEMTFMDVTGPNEDGGFGWL